MDLRLNDGDRVGRTLAVDDLARACATVAFKEALNSGLSRNLILLLRPPEVSPDGFEALIDLVGEPSPVRPGVERLCGHPRIQVFAASGVPDADPEQDQDDAQILHHDFSARETPPSRAILYVEAGDKEVARSTWIDMRAVYRRLSPELQRQVLGRRVIHPRVPGQVNAGVHRRRQTLTEAEALDGTAHPLVCVHPPTGQPMLFLPARRDSRVEGMSAREGRELLTRLWDEVACCPARWTAPYRPGDIFIWDNLATVHDRGASDSTFDRAVWFLNLGATKPVAFVAGRTSASRSGALADSPT